MDFISQLSIFVLACFVGYYVVWSVTPALHTPLMSVTNAISSVIIVGALIAGSPSDWNAAKWLGLLAVVLASINIFGGFAVTERMLAMYKKKDGSADKGSAALATAGALLSKGVEKSKELAAEAQKKLAERQSAGDAATGESTSASDTKNPQ